MSHHHRSLLRTALRLFNLDPRFKTCAPKRLGNVCGCCGADANNQNRHHSNCMSQLATLNVPDEYASLRSYWREGHSPKEIMRFPSSGTGYAYYMGRHWRMPIESAQVVRHSQSVTA